VTWEATSATRYGPGTWRCWASDRAAGKTHPCHKTYGVMEGLHRSAGAAEKCAGKLAAKLNGKVAS